MEIFDRSFSFSPRFFFFFSFHIFNSFLPALVFFGEGGCSVRVALLGISRHSRYDYRRRKGDWWLPILSEKKKKGERMGGIWDVVLRDGI